MPHHPTRATMTPGPLPAQPPATTTRPPVADRGHPTPTPIPVPPPPHPRVSSPPRGGEPAASPPATRTRPGPGRRKLMTDQPTRNWTNGRTLARIRTTLANRDRQPDGTLTCQLCDQPITPDQPTEVDHIHGQAAGGDHQLANLRLTHAACNNDRGHAQQRVQQLIRTARVSTPQPRSKWQRLADQTDPTRP
jgi:HNH endonuclease